MASDLPEEVIDRFRASSTDRLARIEALWSALSQGVGRPEMATELHRHVHTLKGDAHLVEFGDVALVCQKLEDLLAAAATQRYQVSADLDLSVTMALGFVRLLLRRPTDEALGGIDLDGFVDQVERALRLARVTGGTLAPPLAAASAPAGAAARALAIARSRLTGCATSVFLEYLAASGSSRTRLREVWSVLREEIEDQAAVPLADVIRRQAAAAPELARSLGKRVEVDTELARTARVDTRTVEAIDLALLHLVRNALAHGIEAPAERGQQGKPAHGQLSIRARELGRSIEVAVADDGAGVDLEGIRKAVVDRGLMHPDLAQAAGEAALCDVLFLPGFTTRAVADELAGRGVGLDAVREAMTRVGGSARLETTWGRGTTVTLRVPIAVREVEVVSFGAYGGRVGLAVTRDWQITATELTDLDAEVIDPLAALSVQSPGDETGMMRSGPPLRLELERDGVRVTLVGAAPLLRTRALRICATGASAPVEVVAIGGAEALLLRPDRLERRS